MLTADQNPLGQYTTSHNVHVAAFPAVVFLQIADEPQLLQAVCDKVGPFASKEKLLWHLRASRGKVHWAGGRS